MEYLCHYTELEKAKKIINSMSLKFGKIINSNDPIEIKKQDIFPPVSNITEEEENVIKELKLKLNWYLRKILQVSCFSIGTIKNLRDYDFVENGRIISTDIDLEDDLIENVFVQELLKRPPYYLPRMWAQYGEKHKGVCLIFNKKILIKQIQEQVKHLYNINHRKVKYKDFLKNEGLELVYQSIKYSYEDLITSDAKIIVNEELKSRSNYIYFTKDIDWKDEREYRFLLWNKPENDNFDNVYIKIDNESLIGVILGLDNKSSQLVKLSKDKAIRNIMKLKYDDTHISLREIH